MSMYFGKGYLGSGAGGGKPMANRQIEPKTTEQPDEPGGDDTGDIEAHLRARHEATGHAHSHIEHHGDGRHTSHHIDDAGEFSGPHEHGSDDELHEHMHNFISGGEGKPEDDDEEFAD